MWLWRLWASCCSPCASWNPVTNRIKPTPLLHHKLEVDIVVRSAAQAKDCLVCLAALGVQIEIDMLVSIWSNLPGDMESCQIILPVWN